MGLTIHYSLHSRVRTGREAWALINQLREFALGLNFEKVSKLSTFVANHEQDDPRAAPWLRFFQSLQGKTVHEMEVLPRRAVGFQLKPGPGCEQPLIALAQYPKVVTNKLGQQLPTKLRGWYWSAFCKTQYASNPKDGGWENFRRCHVGLIELLDHAETIGIKTDVYDEGNYYRDRDLAKLEAEITRWNRMMAAFTGTVMDQVTTEIQAPIKDYPNFEHLEAQGRQDELE